MSFISNRYTNLVGIEHPVVQEGLGPFKTPKLAAAVSEAGGLGTVSMPGMPVDIEIGAKTFREHIEECASLTDKPFAVNIPVGVDRNGEVLPFTDTYINMVLEAREKDDSLARQLSVITTSAGFPGPYIKAIKDAGMIHQHKVGSTRQAVKSEEAGIDVIIAAGFEMGGHAPSKAVHTYVLVPNITEAVEIPVILTGGARDGRSLASALAMGAEGIAMGSRFIVSHENADWHENYLNAILNAKEGDDVAFEGVYGPCRGLRNSASEQLLTQEATDSGSTVGQPSEVDLMRWKIESMQISQVNGDVDNGLVLAGQVSSSLNELIHVAEFVPTVTRDAADILKDLASNLQQTVKVN